MAGRLGTSGRKDDSVEQKDGTLGHEHDRSRWSIVSDQRARDPFGPRLSGVDLASALGFRQRLTTASPNGPVRPGNLLAIGQTEKSLAETRRALVLDPLNLSINTHMGHGYIYAGRFDQAVEQILKILETRKTEAASGILRVDRSSEAINTKPLKTKKKRTEAWPGNATLNIKLAGLCQSLPPATPKGIRCVATPLMIVGLCPM
jgi:hypothetical protein